MLAKIGRTTFKAVGSLFFTLVGIIVVDLFLDHYGLRFCLGACGG